MSKVELPLQNETVSVIIPVFNGERCIREALESVFSQTYTSLEILVVDDASTDGTLDILKQYGERIRTIRMWPNHGVARARNTALECANGRYIAFLDSDDVWAPNKLQLQLDLLRDKGAAFCFTAYERMSDSGVLMNDRLPFQEKVTYRQLLRNTLIATSSVLLDRNLVGDFRMPLMRSGQDYATWLQLLRHLDAAFGLPDSLMRYRVRKNSLSSGKWKSIAQVWYVQTRLEHISAVKAAFNTFCFCLNAFKKHYTTF
jgi:teichuronic acid biosynthesis glycosyltransferase TuaG